MYNYTAEAKYKAGIELAAQHLIEFQPTRVYTTGRSGKRFLDDILNLELPFAFRNSVLNIPHEGAPRRYFEHINRDNNRGNKPIIVEDYVMGGIKHDKLAPLNIPMLYLTSKIKLDGPYIIYPQDKDFAQYLEDNRSTVFGKYNYVSFR